MSLKQSLSLSLSVSLSPLFPHLIMLQVIHYALTCPCMLNVVIVTRLQCSTLLCIIFFTHLHTNMFATNDFEALYIHPHSPMSRVMFGV